MNEEVLGIQSIEPVDNSKRQSGIEQTLANISDRQVIESARNWHALDKHHLTEDDVKDMVDRIRKILEALDANIDVKIKHDKEIKDLILGMQIVFMDKRTKKIIKSVPPDQLLKLYKEMLKHINFFLIDAKV